MENNAENEIVVKGIKRKRFTERISVFLWASCVHKQVSMFHLLLEKTPVEGAEDHPNTRPLSLYIRRSIWSINNHDRS